MALPDNGKLDKITATISLETNKNQRWFTCNQVVISICVSLSAKQDAPHDRFKGKFQTKQADVKLAVKQMMSIKTQQ